MKFKVVENIKGKIKDWKGDISLIETKQKEAFCMGSAESAESFIKIQGELTKKIEDLVRKNMKDKEELAQEYEKREKTNKEQYAKTIKELEDAHEDNCKFCRKSMENERTRFKTRQMYFAVITDKLDLLQQKQKQKAGNLVKQADTALTALAQMVSSKTDFVIFEEEFDKIIKEAQPYLSLELQDGFTDKHISFEKTLDSHIMIDAPKQSEKKKDEGGLV